jgi:hypothetical protein
LGALIALLGGCGSLDNCPDGQDPISILDGETDKDALSYDSAPWGGPLPHFPAKTALYFKHDLGVTPRLVLPFLSFKDVGTADDEGGSVALTAGNQTLIDCVDARVIVLRNDTCEPSFYVRVATEGAVAPKFEVGDKCCTKAPDIAACSDDP